MSTAPNATTTKPACDGYLHAAKPTKLVQFRREKSPEWRTQGQSDVCSAQHTAATGPEHPLRFAWSFWFIHRAPGHKINDYEAAMTKIATVATVEAFWAAYSHLKRADQVPTITDYHMFRAGVRPVWEDPANISGGKWMIRLKKGLSPRMWERLAMAVVGDMFGVGEEVCGIVLSIRNSEDIISLWNKTALDTKSNLHIRDTMKLAMGLPPACILEYKAHNDSLKDNSSFRNTDIYK
ncbi:hypothetical protein IWW55_000864 [Coemansia sp. RSA 2706]|nr:hypothetical protein IWW55_000864 [Coemansia sp. RSA 2706]KAJ2312554.1 hypothetical protein IWW54_002022 [Coemansia sp. RSA 2705]KAJ2320114.1 hypothetical protein IWW51_004709 [Coemansia sp. RSA 2702]KAJ2388168.1 hypothetical protein H4S02_003005 [Coemansia sp. RSA 2611]KAJ2737849.1 hypothetical protein H4R23_001557 [Coemansia sp. Cherry 401B]